jgi:hypothetical protein
MKIFLPLLLLLSVAPAFAQDKPKPPKPVYRTLNKLLKQYRKEADAKVIATR